MACAKRVDSTVPWILVSTTAPVMLDKHIINVLQLEKASRWLAEGDIAKTMEAFGKNCTEGEGLDDLSIACGLLWSGVHFRRRSAIYYSFSWLSN